MLLFWYYDNCVLKWIQACNELISSFNSFQCFFLFLEKKKTIQGEHAQAFTFMMSWTQCILVFINPRHYDFPFAVDIIKLCRFSGQLFSDVFSKENVLKNWIFVFLSCCLTAFDGDQFYNKNSSINIVILLLKLKFHMRVANSEMFLTRQM